MIRFKHAIRFIPPLAISVATTVSALALLTPPANALPTCREQVNRMCSQYWQDMGYASYQECVNTETAQQCPGCPPGNDPEGPGGPQCTVYP